MYTHTHTHTTHYSPTHPPTHPPTHRSSRYSENEEKGAGGHFSSGDSRQYDTPGTFSYYYHIPDERTRERERESRFGRVLIAP